jgi:hypothetical protein
MTALRLISLPVHGALEMFVGLVLMAAPVALGLSTPAAILGIVLGTAIVGLALSSTAAEYDGRSTITIAAHHSFDYGLVVGLLGSSVLLGLAGSDSRAAVLFAALAVAQLTLNLTTRYSRR